jgi:hypothetical protein
MLQTPDPAKGPEVGPSPCETNCESKGIPHTRAGADLSFCPHKLKQKRPPHFVVPGDEKDVIVRTLRKEVRCLAGLGTEVLGLVEVCTLSDNANRLAAGEPRKGVTGPLD